MSDGAHLGVTPHRALETILGNKPPPEDDEVMDAATFCAWLRSAPDVPDNSADGYTECGRIMAKFILLLLDEQPEVISDDPYELIKKVVTRFPQSKDNADQLTGFLAGWAINAARRCIEMPPVQNPAILDTRITYEQ